MFRTVAEMHEDLDLLIDKVESPRFTSPEKDRVLNMAQDRIIQDRYDNIRRDTGYSFQSLQRVRDEMRTLIKELPYVPVVVNPGGYYTFTLPANYRHEILLQANINANTVTSIPIDYDTFGVAEEDPFNKFTANNPRHVESGATSVKIYTGTGTLFYVALSYIKNPAAIDLNTSTNSELPGTVHNELENIAASILNGTVEDYQKYQLLEKESKES
tara:strand:+ start:2146 stop:2790 length:645 start_codon:yes stop_codon:yes gene_type:complete